MSISSRVLEEVAALAGSESLLFSMASVVSPALRTDHILLAAEPGVTAWQAQSEALHLNFWTENGTRIDVEERLQVLVLVTSRPRTSPSPLRSC